MLLIFTEFERHTLLSMSALCENEDTDADTELNGSLEYRRRHTNE